jgi:hypothetical protein
MTMVKGAALAGRTGAVHAGRGAGVLRRSEPVGAVTVDDGAGTASRVAGPEARP